MVKTINVAERGFHRNWSMAFNPYIWSLSPSPRCMVSSLNNGFSRYSPVCVSLCLCCHFVHCFYLKTLPKTTSPKTSPIFAVLPTDHALGASLWSVPFISCGNEIFYSCCVLASFTLIHIDLFHLHNNLKGAVFLLVPRLHLTDKLFNLVVIFGKNKNSQ